MTLLAEQPMLVSIMSGCLAAALVYAWLQTGKKAAAMLGLICLALIPAAFAVAANWQTDREQIREIIEATAEAVQANDHQKAVSVIDDEDAKRMALSELPNYEFEMAAVNQYRRITVQPGAFPPTAIAELTVKVDVSAKRGGIRNIRVLRKLDLDFEKRGDTWVVVNYRHAPVLGGSVIGDSAIDGVVGRSVVDGSSIGNSP